MDFVNKFGMKKLILTGILVLALIFYLFLPILSIASGSSMFMTGKVEYEGLGLFELMSEEGPTGVIIFYGLISALLTAGAIAAVILGKSKRNAIFATTAWCVLTLITTMIYGSGWEEAINVGWGLWIAVIASIASAAVEVVLPENFSINQNQQPVAEVVEEKVQQ